jgi:FkbM family methyltransferase
VERWGRLAADGVLTRRLVNGCTIACDLEQYIDRHIYFLGLYEPVELYLITRLLEPDATVVDGGANIGLYSLMMSTVVGETGSVHAFEPVPGTHAKLVENVGRNRLTNVTVTQAGLSDRTGIVTLGLEQENGDNTGAFGIGHRKSESSVDISTMPFDEYAAAHSLESVDFVKLDVEGSELRALHGMRGVLGRDEPTLLVEVCRETARRAGFSPDDILDMLGPLGYRAFVIRESRAASGYVDTLGSIGQSNVLFHTGPTPAVLEQEWDLRMVLKWARGGAASISTDQPRSV